MAKVRKTRDENTAITNTTKIRLIFILVLVALCFLAIFGKLIYLQVFDAADQYAAQVDQSVTQVETSSSRGNILDRNGNILVQDSAAKAVYIVPVYVTKGEEERISQVLSEKLDLDYDEVYATVTMLEDNSVAVENNVSAATFEKLIERISVGFYYDDETLYCVPDEIEDIDAAAALLVEFFEMDAEDAYDYLRRRENSPQRIKTKVASDLADEIRQEICVYNEKTGELEDSNGLTLLDDHIRYYTGSTYLSHVLGFTNDSYHGVCGIEATCDDVLSGESGVVLYQQDANGNNIPSQTKVISEPTQGEDVTLTIDINVQNLAEAAVKEATQRWGADSATMIVMSTKTGEVLAMASYPNYDLNDPYTISDSYAIYQATNLSALEDESEQLNYMWRNPAVSFNYEPGSTFKAITASSALEEGVVSPDTTVYCSGYYPVGDEGISCTGYHGTQTVHEAVANSCNPGLTQIIEQLDPKIFYQYAYNFGYGRTTGIELNGEEAGILNRIFDDNDYYVDIDYATMSFGQGIATTPIQNLTALNAVVNDGYYMKPTILSEDNSDRLTRNTTGKATKQVISAGTSAEMRSIMADVIANNSTLSALAEGYSIGGKTGTAEKFVNGSYSGYSFVTSFFCFAPVDDPEYSIIMIVDGTDGSLTGSVAAAPYAINVMKQILSGNSNSVSGEVSGTVTMPDLTGQSVDNAVELLEENGITYRVVQQDEGTTVLSQSLAAGTVYSSGTEVEIVVGTVESDELVTVPDLTGLSIQGCNRVLRGLGLTLKASGSGYAVSQNPAAGTKVERNSTITVKFER